MCKIVKNDDALKQLKKEIQVVIDVFNTEKELNNQLIKIFAMGYFYNEGGETKFANYIDDNYEQIDGFVIPECTNNNCLGFIVSEKYDGTIDKLADYTEEKIMSIVSQIDIMFKKGFAHLDVKNPKNWFYKRDGAIIKIGDFGETRDDDTYGVRKLTGQIDKVKTIAVVSQLLYTICIIGEYDFYAVGFNEDIKEQLDALYSLLSHHLSESNKKIIKDTFDSWKLN